MALLRGGVVLAWLALSLGAFAQSPPFAVELRAVQGLSSADAVCGQTVLFSTVKAFAFGGQTFPVGTTATGEVTKCTPSRRIGRGGVLEIKISSVQLPDGHTFRLSGVAVFHGGSRALGVAGGAVAAGLLLTPYAVPVALFVHGKAALMPAGAVVVATISTSPPAASKAAGPGKGLPAARH